MSKASGATLVPTHEYYKHDRCKHENTKVARAACRKVRAQRLAKRRR